MKDWPDNSVDAIVTDIPYGIGFMGKEWDTFKDAVHTKHEGHYTTTNSDGSTIRHKKGFSAASNAGLYDLSRNAEYQEWCRIWSAEALRIAKPGAFLLCFGGTRTFHRVTCGLEDAGWQIRDCMMWLYGSGFPKSHNISKAIEKAKGVEPIGKKPAYGAIASRELIDNRGWNNIDNALIMPETQTELAKLWNGYGTALKPAWEPIIVAMKPLDGTFAHNAEHHGVAGLNIDGGRISHNESVKTTVRTAKRTGAALELNTGKSESWQEGTMASASPQGRWPANLILDEEAAAMLDEQSGESKGGKTYDYTGKKQYQVEGFLPDNKPNSPSNRGDSGGVSRFFYCAKTSRKERNMGMENCEDKLLARSGGAQGAENRGEDKYLQNHIGLNRVAKVKNNHPTVKPLALMKYLCTLLKMPSADQIILDPFLGSGTTGIACKELGINFIGIEKEKEYCEIAVKRIAAVEGHEITLETTLPVSKHLKMHVPGNGSQVIRQARDCQPSGGNENLPQNAEHRQSIIAAANASLRKNQK